MNMACIPSMAAYRSFITRPPIRCGYLRSDGTLDVTGEGATADEAVQQALAEHARRRR